jgi:poly(3-hydroxybutyrate) depolymerase
MQRLASSSWPIPRCGLSWLLALGLGPGVLAGETVITNALVIGSIGRSGRETIHTDAIEARIVAGQWEPPVAGDKVQTPDGRQQAWERAAANTNGWFEDRAFRGGYAYATIDATEPRVAILDAAGHSAVYANGELRTGDPYANGSLRLPVWLRTGRNEFLFSVGRGRLRAKLTDSAAPASLSTADLTLPDLIVGEREPVWAGIVVLNTTTNTTTNLALRVVGTENKGGQRYPVELPPLGARKVPFQIRPPSAARPGEFAFEVQLVAGDRGRWRLLDRAPLKAGVRLPTQLHRRTFLSRLDGSVQYYAVNPPPAATPAPAMFLSVHGAGVEAAGQAAAYAPKAWGVLVSPTNRRPYGFDWEEWGRSDALEVLDLAQQRYRTDPNRTYLTGHSMGGHGTWLLGATFPDRFAAIGPSAGWISFRTYARAGASPDTNSPMQAMLRRAAASGDTLGLVSNYLHHAVYILHGDADDNVPVSEARTMRERLGQFHRDFAWHEQPGAGHWWDASDEPGTDCVDWAPMFDLFARRRIPALAETRLIQFTTVNPGVSSRCRWLTVDAQHLPLLPSHIVARCDPGRRRIIAQTTNIARVSFEVGSILPPGTPIAIELDGQKLPPRPWPAPAVVRKATTPGPSVAFERAGDQWREAAAADLARKNPLRYGPFREAFSRRMLFVYATRGTAAENGWALAKARLDAESFGYRGNGSVDVIPDTEYLAHPDRAALGPAPAKRNVILYGHADAHAAWPLLLGQSPVQVRRGSVRIGTRELHGQDLGVLFLQPHPADPAALVGVVAGSGLPGLRLTERLPVFLAGPGFPDCLVVSTDMLTNGIEGVRAAGFFGLDWGVTNNDFVWGPGWAHAP